MSIEQNLGAELTSAANAIVADDFDTYGDSAVALMKKCRMTQVLLEVAGVTKGAPVTPQVVVALDAIAAVSGLVTAQKPDKALARFIATGVGASPLIDLAVRTEAKAAAAKAADAIEAEAARDMGKRFAPQKTGAA